MNYITIRKSGTFYHVYDDDAIILNYLFNYVIKNDRLGFPCTTLSKVLNILDDKKINYIVKDDKEIISNNKNKNSYNKILILALENKRKYDKLELIHNKISSLNMNDINEIYEYIINKY